MTKEKINFIHIVFGIYMIQIAVDMFRLPTLLAEDFGTNGWIAIIVVSALVTLHIYLISLIYRLGKGRSIFEILEGAAPKLVLIPIYLGMSLVFGLLATFIGLHYTLIIQLISFPSTPVYLFNGMLILLAFIFVSLGVYNMFKATTIFFFLTIWTVILFFFYFTGFDFVRLTPHIFSGGSGQFLHGSFKIYATFFGFEVFLFLFPYIDKKTKTFKAVFWGHMITTMVYFLVSFISFGFFSLEQLQYVFVPGIDLLSYIELPFVERVENIVFNVFIGEIIVTVGFYYWVAMETLGRVFPKVKPIILLTLLLIPCFLYSIKFDVILDVHKFLEKLSVVHACIIVSLTLILLAILLLQKNTLRRRQE